jgi:hypothetical protein
VSVQSRLVFSGETGLQVGFSTSCRLSERCRLPGQGIASRPGHEVEKALFPEQNPLVRFCLKNSAFEDLAPRRSDPAGQAVIIT